MGSSIKQFILPFEGGRIMGDDSEELEYDAIWSAILILCHISSNGLLNNNIRGRELFLHMTDGLHSVCRNSFVVE